LDQIVVHQWFWEENIRIHNRQLINLYKGVCSIMSIYQSVLIGLIERISIYYLPNSSLFICQNLEVSIKVNIQLKLVFCIPKT